MIKNPNPGLFYFSFVFCWGLCVWGEGGGGEGKRLGQREVLAREC